MIKRLTYRLLILIFSSVSLTSFSQNNGINPKIKSQIAENQNYLFKQAVRLNNGSIPFQENGKWGIKTALGEVFLPAIYDSILNGDGDKFITVRNSEYQLLDFDLWNWFDSSVVYIRGNNKSFIVVDKDGITTRYQTYSGTNTLYPLDQINHLTKKPKAADNVETFKPTIRRVLVNHASFIIDSVQISLNNRSANEFIFFREGKEHWRCPSYFRDYSFQGNKYFLYSKEVDGVIMNYVFDLKTLSPVLSVKAAQLTYFEAEGKDYFLVGKIPGEERLMRVFDSESNLIVELQGNYQFINGRFVSEYVSYGGNGLKKYNFYSFPDMKVVENNVTVFPLTDVKNVPMLVTQSDNKSRSIYLNSQLIYSFVYEGFVSISSTGLNPHTGEGLISIQLEKAKHKARRNILISTKGTVFDESKTSFVGDYNPEFEQVRVRYYEVIKRKLYLSLPMGIYDEQADQLKITPFKNPDWQQIDTNLFLYKDYYRNDRTGRTSQSFYFMDVTDNCINEEIYSEYQYPTTYSRNLIQLKSGQIPAIYNNHLEKFCDSCYFEGLNNTSIKSAYIVFNPNMNEAFLQLMDEDFNLLLPDKYLAIYYTGTSISVLTKERQIRYFPLPLKSEL